MIKIHIEMGKLEVCGHAMFAEKGKDIVCAGVSTLVYTLAKALEDRKLLTSFEIDDASAFLKWDITKTSNTLTDAFKGGFELIAGTYPDNVVMV